MPLNTTDFNTKVSSSAEMLEKIKMPVQRQLQEVENELQTSSHSTPLNYLVNYHCAAGKRIRPTIVLLASACFDPFPPKLAINLATSIELLHLATLAHDDLIDNASKRHGQSSIYGGWGKNAAVLLGDYFFALFLQTMAKCRGLGLTELSQVVHDLIQAEFWQQERNWEATLTIDNYLSRTKLKTANFFAACAKLGGLSGQANSKMSRSLYSYGQSLGLAFQIQDDLLDCTGNPSVTGKPCFQDLQQGLLTLPMIYVLKKSKRKKQLTAAINRKISEPDDVNLIKQEMQETRAIELSQKTASIFLQIASFHLNNLPPSAARKSLFLLTDYVLSRNA